MFTNNLKKVVENRKKRIGRGPGSGKGFHTVGRGQKGQTSRGGYHAKRGFEGGQVPLHKSLPRTRGFRPGIVKEKVTAISITKLLAKDVYQIDSAVLATMTRSEKVRLVGATDYSQYDLKKVVIKSGVALTASLKAAIVEAGGKVEE